MDVAAFSGETFDAKDWINKALRASDSTQPKVGAGLKVTFEVWKHNICGRLFLQIMCIMKIIKM